jgi:hypothetical protein
MNTARSCSSYQQVRDETIIDRRLSMPLRPSLDRYNVFLTMLEVVFPSMDPPPRAACQASR